MTNWVYPLGTAADGQWDVSIGTFDSSLTVDGWEHTGLKVASLAAGADVVLPAAAEERIVVPLNGSFTVTVDGDSYELNGRSSVFSGPSDVLYSDTGRTVTIGSSEGGRVAVATAPANASYPTRRITAAETPVELRGAVGNIVTSPLAVLAKVTDGQITYFQLLEDTFAAVRSFPDGRNLHHLLGPGWGAL